MSCYHPFVAIPKDEPNANGKVEYRIIGSRSDHQEYLQVDPRAILIPCGKCIGCRLDYSRQWADRMMLELDSRKKAIFVTLTYDNDHVPFTEDEETGSFGWLTLDKRDLQLFFKRLRKYFSDKEIKYYASGEYGSHTLRPHYHAIIFGLSIEDFPDHVLKGRNELGQRHFTSGTLQSIWSNGFVVLAEVNWRTCAYVSRYVQKKVFHGMQYSDLFGVVPEFSLCSRRPGIGSKFLDDHKFLFDSSTIYVNGVPDGMKIPKYFLKKLSLIDPEKYDMLCEERQQYAKDSDFLKSQSTDLGAVDRLEIEENEKLNQITALRRNLCV